MHAPGSTVVIVVEDQIKLQRFTERAGCKETEVLGTGGASEADPPRAFMKISPVSVRDSEEPRRKRT